MPRYFSYLVVGRPQLLALLLLAAFAAQAVWLAHQRPFSSQEQDHIWSGRQQLEQGALPRKFDFSPLVNIASAAPIKIDENREVANPTPERVQAEVHRLRLHLRFPFLLMGLLLGGSVWYVARRLYGNSGGYIALSLYCFSPAMVLGAASIDQALPAAWGAFGIVFTSIAISHNLYAPWKRWIYRTVLLAIAITLAVASHPSTMIMVPVGFALMAYLAPGRRWAAIAVTIVAGIISVVLVFALYGFSPRAMFDGIDQRDWFVYAATQAQQLLFGNPDLFLSRFNFAVLLLLLVALITYFAWPRARYFGNTAPLLILAGLLYLAFVSPLVLDASIWALPFLFVFIAGIWADLLETRRALWVLGALAVLLAENALFGVLLVQRFAVLHV
jgi:hypothetical protein